MYPSEPPAGPASLVSAKNQGTLSSSVQVYHSSKSQQLRPVPASRLWQSLSPGLVQAFQAALPLLEDQQSKSHPDAHTSTSSPVLECTARGRSRYCMAHFPSGRALRHRFQPNWVPKQTYSLSRARRMPLLLPFQSWKTSSGVFMKSIVAGSLSPETAESLKTGLPPSKKL